MEDGSIKVINSLSHGTNEGVAYPKFWTAVLVQMNTEKRVADKLNRLGIENFVPVQTEIRQWSDRKKKIDKVVIPMVVFVRIDKKTERILRTYSFIYKFISYPGQKEAAIIPEDQIDALKTMLNQSEASVEVCESVLKLGDVVEIIHGPLKGLIGELCYVEQGKPMVALRIDCLGYACVNVNRSEIKIINNK